MAGYAIKDLLRLSCVVKTVLFDEPGAINKTNKQVPTELFDEKGAININRTNKQIPIELTVRKHNKFNAIIICKVCRLELSLLLLMGVKT